jgi:hypothetical protein
VLLPARATTSAAGWDCPALIVADNVKRVLADIDADHGDPSIELVGHGVLLVFGAPCQLRLLAGPEHGRTIPLPDIDQIEMPQRMLSWCAPGCVIVSAGKHEKRHQHSISIKKIQDRPDFA